MCVHVYTHTYSKVSSLCEPRAAQTSVEEVLLQHNPVGYPSSCYNCEAGLSLCSELAVALGMLQPWMGSSWSWSLSIIPCVGPAPCPQALSGLGLWLDAVPQLLAGKGLLPDENWVHPPCSQLCPPGQRNHCGSTAQRELAVRRLRRSAPCRDEMVAAGCRPHPWLGGRLWGGRSGWMLWLGAAERALRREEEEEEVTIETRRVALGSR